MKQDINSIKLENGNPEVAPKNEISFNENSGEAVKDTKVPIVRVYKRRYIMLFLYGFRAFLNGFQFIQFSIITSIVTCYYDVSVFLVNWTSNLYPLMFFIFIFPAMWIMSRKGLKTSLLIAATLQTLAAAIQCFSLARDRFFVAFLSQVLSAIAQAFSVSAPPFIAALWFGPREVSLACAIALILNNLGVATGFLVPPEIVPNNCNDPRDIRAGLTSLSLGLATLTFISFLLIVLVFEDKPPNPPSIAEAKKNVENISTFQWIKRFLRDRNFTLLVMASGLLLSAFSAIATMLNQMVVRVFPGREVDAGYIGTVTVFTGMFGNLLFGHILDRTKKFRQLAVTIYTFALIFVVAYTICSSQKILWLHYTMFGLMGFFLSGFLGVAFEFGSELAYPGPEGISGTLLYSSSQILGIVVTVTSSALQQNYSDLASNIFFSIIVLLGFCNLVFVKCDPKRTKLELESSSVSTELPEVK